MLRCKFFLCKQYNITKNSLIKNAVKRKFQNGYKSNMYVNSIMYWNVYIWNIMNFYAINKLQYSSQINNYILFKTLKKKNIYKNIYLEEKKNKKH